MYPEVCTLFSSEMFMFFSYMNNYSTRYLYLSRGIFKKTWNFRKNRKISQKLLTKVYIGDILYISNIHIKYIEVVHEHHNFKFHGRSHLRPGSKPDKGYDKDKVACHIKKI